MPWRNPLVHLDTWAAGDDSEGTYLEQHTINIDARFNPLFPGHRPVYVDPQTGDIMTRAMASRDRGVINVLAEKLRTTPAPLLQGEQRLAAADYLMTFATYHLPPLQV